MPRIALHPQGRTQLVVYLGQRSGPESRAEQGDDGLAMAADADRAESLRAIRHIKLPVLFEFQTRNPITPGTSMISVPAIATDDASVMPNESRMIVCS